MVLPPELTPFIGRAADLGRLRERFEAGRRLVTVLGPAGMGKTRLALRFAREWDGPAFFADLSAASDAGQLGAALAATLDAPLPPTGDPAAHLAGVLAGQGPCLVVLDNFEQLVDAGPRTLGIWLAGAPEARFLVTSRARLHLGAEVVHPLDPLTPDEGLALLLQHARATRPDYDPGEADRRALEIIVQRVDGIPLAVELAGSRLAVLSAEALEARLSDRFAVLRGQRRDVTGRQATLFGAIEWSWRLLSAEEQAALACCAVFPADFDAAGFEAVAGPLDVAQALVDRSFLRATADGLAIFESIRDFAATHLDAPARALAEARHAAWALALGARYAAGVDGPEGLRHRAQLAAIRDHLLAVVHRALLARRGDEALAALDALHPVLTTRGPFERHAAWLDAALECHEDPARGARGLFLRGHLRRIRGQLAAAAADLEAACAAARALGDPAAWAEAQAELGIVRHEHGELDAAGQAFTGALEGWRALGHPRGEARVLGSLAVLDHEQGRTDEAQVRYEQALRCLADVGDARSRAIFLSNLGSLHLEHGRVGEAGEHFRGALVALEAAGDRRVAGVVTGNLGAVLQEEGRPEAARALRQKAVDTMRAVGDRRMEAVFLGYTGCADHEAGHLAQARAAYRDAAAALEVAGDRRHAGLFCAHLGAAEAMAGAPEAARRAFERAARHLASVEDPAVHAVLQVHLGHLDPVDAARRRLVREAAPSDDLRFARRLLRAVVGDPPEAPAGRVLTCSERGFTPPGGATVHFGRRDTLRRLVHALALRRRHLPGRPLSVDDLLEAGWPGERMMPSAGANRVYVAVATLRGLGLRDVLLSREGGYLFDPDVELQDK